MAHSDDRIDKMSSGVKFRPDYSTYNAHLQPLVLLSIIFLSLLGCALRLPFLARAAVVLSIAALTAAFIGWTKGPAVDGDYGVANFLVAHAFMMSDYLLVTKDLHMDLRQRKKSLLTNREQKENGAVGNGVSDAPLSERLKWASQLLVSIRGVGWDHEAPNHTVVRLVRREQVGQRNPRLHFLLNRVLAIVGDSGAFALGDFMLYVNPSFRVDGPPFSSQAWWFKPAVLGYALVPYATLSILHSVIAIITVCLLGIGEPGDWPPMFGRLADGTSVARFWGRVWHQTLRRPISSHIALVERTVISPLKLGKNGKLLVKIILAFSISGLIHHCTAYAALRRFHSNSMLFFLLQPLAIFVERLVSKTVVLQPKHVWLNKAFGMVWTALWFTMTLPLFLEPFVRVGLLEDSPHITAVEPLAERVRIFLGV